MDSRFFYFFIFLFFLFFLISWFSHGLTKRKECVNSWSFTFVAFCTSSFSCFSCFLDFPDFLDFLFSLFFAWINEEVDCLTLVSRVDVEAKRWPWVFFMLFCFLCFFCAFFSSFFSCFSFVLFVFFFTFGIADGLTRWLTQMWTRGEIFWGEAAAMVFTSFLFFQYFLTLLVPSFFSVFLLFLWGLVVFSTSVWTVSSISRLGFGNRPLFSWLCFVFWFAVVFFSWINEEVDCVNSRAPAAAAPGRAGVQGAEPLGINWLEYQSTV